MAHPADFKLDVVIPIPKEGDSTECGAYSAIVLQSTAGKAYAQLISGATAWVQARQKLL